MKPSKLIWLDIETFFDTANKYCLRSLSIYEYVKSPQFHMQMIGMLVDDEYIHIDSEEELQYYAHLFSADSGYTVVAHNAAFDGLVLQHLLGDKFKCPVVCTQHIARVVLGNVAEGTSLNDLCAQLGLGAKVEGALSAVDGVRDPQDAQRDELAVYLEQDVNLLHALYNSMAPFMPDAAWDTLTWAMDVFIRPKLVTDPVILEIALEEEVLRVEGIVAESGYTRKQLSSAVSLANILDGLGVPPPMKTSPATGMLTYAFSKQDNDFLDLRYHENEDVRRVVRARLETKSTIEETRLKSVLSVSRLLPDHAWPVHIIPSGAHTHRPTGGPGAGGNPLNYGRDSKLREAVGPREGHTLIVFDYSGIELRIARFLVGDRPAIKSIQDGEDLYKNLASHWFNVDVDEVDYDQRFSGKTGQLSLQYGIGVDTFTKRLRLAGVSTEDLDVRSMVHTFRKRAHPALPQWWYGAGEQILEYLARGSNEAIPLPCSVTGPEGVTVQSGKIVFPSGRTLQYPDLHRTSTGWAYIVRSAAAKRGNALDKYLLDPVKWEGKSPAGVKYIYGAALLENLAQGLTNEIMSETRGTIHKALKKLGKYSGVAFEVYDELGVSVPDKYVPVALKLINIVATKSPEWWPNLPLEIEMNTGSSWAEAK